METKYDKMAKEGLSREEISDLKFLLSIRSDSCSYNASAYIEYLEGKYKALVSGLEKIASAEVPDELTISELAESILDRTVTLSE